MELRRVERTATIAWGTTESSSHLIAAGSVAGTLDFTFETTAALELFEWRPGTPSSELPVVGATHAPDRFHALSWGRHGPSGMGLLAGGLTNGVVSLWDPASILGSHGDVAPLSSAAKHAGAVQGLDWNPSMTHLLASCGADGQLLIWDVTSVGGDAKPLSVYSPGSRVKPITDGMACVAWNKAPTVPHILAGALSNGSCEIWDLKNKKQVISFHDAKRSSRCGQRSLSWHPTEPTMIIQACDDDASPVALVWDLKHYAAPVAVLSGHTRGVTCVAWSGKDLSLALTSSRDGSSILWDVPSATPRSHLCAANEKSFHVQSAWAPLVRAHLATASSDGHIAVHAVVDPGPKGRVVAAKLGHAPSWMSRPCGASFGFGGRLLTFNSSSRTVNIKHVVTDPELVEHAKKLREHTSSQEALISLCDERRSALSKDEAAVWELLRVLLQGADRSTALLSVLALNDESAEVSSSSSSESNIFEHIGGSVVAGDGERLASLWNEANAWESRAGRLACVGRVREAWKECASANQWASALVLARELGGDSEYGLCKAAWLQKGIASSFSEGAPQICAGLLPLLGSSRSNIVSHGPLLEWKALAAAAVAWGGGSATEQLSVLAERLSTQGQSAAAQLCLLGAEDVDGLASIWSSASVTESVLRLTCANRALGVKLAANTSSLASFVSVLADSLAAQGDLSGALYWLETIDSPSNGPPHIRLLYERLRASRAPLSASTSVGAQRPAAHVASTRAAPYGVTPASVASTSATVTPLQTGTAPGMMRQVPVPVPVPVPAPPAPASAPFVAPVLPSASVHVHPPSPAVMPVPTLVPVAAPAIPGATTSGIPTMTTTGAAPAPVQSVGNAATGAACDRLTAAVEAVGADGTERASKLSIEVAKRIPALRSKLDTISASQTEPLVSLLDSLTAALRAGNAAEAGAIYASAQQNFHVQLGSTGMLALKRCIDLVKK